MPSLPANLGWRNPRLSPDHYRYSTTVRDIAKLPAPDGSDASRRGPFVVSSDHTRRETQVAPLPFLISVNCEICGQDSGDRWPFIKLFVSLVVADQTVQNPLMDRSLWHEHEIESTRSLKREIGDRQ